MKNKLKHKRPGPSLKYKEGGCVRKSISIPLNVWKELEKIANRDSLSISAVVIAMIKNNLDLTD